MCYMNWSALKGFSPLRKIVSPYIKNYENFSHVFNQLLARHLYYFNLAPKKAVSSCYLGVYMINKKECKVVCRYGNYFSSCVQLNIS